MNKNMILRYAAVAATAVIIAVIMIYVQTTEAYAQTGIPLDTTDITIESGQTYTVSNKEELLNFAAIARTGASFKGSTVELLSDISVAEGKFSHMGEAGKYAPVLDGKAITVSSEITWWQPIATHNGQTTGTFSGTFEGNEHTISGLFFDSDSGGEYALFGRCDGAVIRNVTVKNFYFRGANCAGICAKAWNGTVIENCHSIDGILVNRGLSGGILGETINSWGDSKAITRIENCTSRCEIIEGCYHTAGISESYNTGGMVGQCTNTVVRNCTNYGTISGGENIGLIVGYAGEGVTVENCSNTGEAFGTDYKNRVIGSQDDTGEHVHVFSTTYTYDDDTHYYLCKCGQKSQQAKHEFNVSKDIVLVQPTLLKTGKMQRTCSVCGAEVFQIMETTGSYTLDMNMNRADVVILDGNTIRIEPKLSYVITNMYLNGVELPLGQPIKLKNGDVVKVVIYGEEDDKLPAADSDKTIKGVQATSIKASTSAAKGKITIRWKKSAGYKVDYFQVFRSTKKLTGYGTKPFYQTKTGKATYYTNTKSLKKGTRYYYRIRGVRIIDGKKYYTKWSNIANRTAI